MSSPIKYPEKVATKTSSEIVRLLMVNKDPCNFTIYLSLRECHHITTILGTRTFQIRGASPASSISFAQEACSFSQHTRSIRALLLQQARRRTSRVHHQSRPMGPCTQLHEDYRSLRQQGYHLLQRIWFGQRFSCRPFAHYGRQVLTGRYSLNSTPKVNDFLTQSYINTDFSEWIDPKIHMTDVQQDGFLEDEALRSHEQLSDYQPQRYCSAIQPLGGFALSKILPICHCSADKNCPRTTQEAVEANYKQGTLT